ncbi:unnamed protein product [Effrenium voratum]|uniref:Uncharacterized protein n=1 Tax=Effrenium voratum TaxID=2562239 RepID=A0AA36MYI4_9DINO|nr:unnamed protein product [Effrenium voratum]
MAAASWNPWECLACCAAAEAPVEPHDAPAEKLIPVSTVFVKSMDEPDGGEQLDAPETGEVLAEQRRQLQEHLASARSRPAKQTAFAADAAANSKMPTSQPQGSQVLDRARDIQEVRNFRHLRTSDQRDTMAIVLARFAAVELTPRISEDRESPELPPAAGTKPLPLRAPVGRLPILGTWRSQKTKCYYFYFEVGDRYNVEFPNTSMVIEHWRGDELLRLEAALLVNDIHAKVPAVYGRLANREKAAKDEFQDGDCVVLPAIVRDHHAFYNCSLNQNLQKFLHCEVVEAAFEANATYDGPWQNGQKHGYGVLMGKDGAKYSGQFQNDKKEGEGVYHYPSGAKYTGQWVNDMQEGQGKEEWADGSVFEGEFKAGTKHGRGKFIWSTLCRYEGEFDNNDMHGEGVYTWSDGRGYSGQWTHNTMAPKGKMWWSDGRTYIGEFLDGRKHGEGTLTWPDGRSYSGQWQDGKQHGTAVAQTAKGLKRQSIWKDGARQLDLRGRGISGLSGQPCLALRGV